MGGIGLNVIQGLRLAGADQIVGVDINPDKIPMATHFGMTDFVNPSEVEGDLVPYLVLYRVLSLHKGTRCPTLLPFGPDFLTVCKNKDG